jgi:ABC-type oligopeptide transport system substrate-binding subunit
MRRLAPPAFGIIASLLLSLGPPAAEAQTVARNVVHRAGTDDATTLDPHKVGYPGETTIMSDLFVGLTTLDVRARPIPGAAESWTVSPDGRTWTFRMRAGLKWSDGSALDARDFEYSLRRALSPATAFPYAGRLFAIRKARAVSAGKAPIDSLGVKASDSRTLVLTLEHPAPYLPEVLASFAMPVPRAVVEKFGDEWIRPGRIVTNGPFMLAEWRPNAFIRLRRNPHFYDAANVPADEVVHYPVTQATTAIRRFQAGELDFVLTVPPDQIDRARREFGDQLKIDQGLGIEVIAFNVNRGATRDPRVRRALSLALEREAIARNVLGDTRLAAYGFVAPGATNYPVPARLDFATWPPERRRAEARSLLAEAGYGPGNPLRIRLAFPANDINRRIAVVVDAMWRSVGVRPELQAKEQRALSADVARGEFDAVRALWLAGHSDALAFLERLDGTAAGTTMNQSGYRSARFDGLLARATAEADLERRARLLREAEEVALADQPVAPLYYFVGRRLVSTRLLGWEHNARGIHVSRYMSVPKR